MRVGIAEEIEPEMRRQNRLRGQRIAENLLDLLRVGGGRGDAAALFLARRVGLVEQHRLLTVADRDRARGAVRIRQNDEKRLALRASERKDTSAEIESAAAR